jgi:hypothetical protein
MLPDASAVFTALGLAATLGCIVLYQWEIYKRRARPHVFTFFNWGLMAVIGALAQDDLHGGASVYVIWATAFGYLLTAFLALFVGEKNITRSDWAAFIVALIAMAIWQAGAHPLYAVALVCFIDVATYFPTVRKSWNDPWGEPVIPYTLAASRYLFAALAVSDKTFSNTVAPLMLGSTDILFAFYLLWRQRAVLRPSSNRRQ